MTKRTLLLGVALVGLFSALGLSQTPVPFINQPLAPASIAPGGPLFRLTVNGTGFVSHSTVMWNGGALATAFVNASQLNAIVPAAKTATAGTAWITVVNPSPGSVTSNGVLLPIMLPSPTVAFSKTEAETGSSPEGAATGDFNGDEKLDLAVANNGSGTVSILLGNGDGTFQSHVDYAAGSAPGSLVTGDFNGDGKLDIAVRNQSSNTVSILLGKGDGTFQPAVSFATGTGNGHIAAADFDRDGKLDLAATNDSDGTVSILLGNGDGTFQPHVDYVTGNSPIAMAIGDLNRDGKLDLIVGDIPGNHRFAFLRGRGNGTFQKQISYSTIEDTESVVLGDVNGDGKIDLIIFGETIGDGVSIWLGDGNGGWHVVANYATGCGSVPENCTAAVADINGDGKADLVVRNSPANTVQILLGAGNGLFQGPLTFATGANPGQVVVGDFNGDGRPDLAIPNFDTASVSILIQAAPPPAATLSLSSLFFGGQLLFTSSPPQGVTLTNTGGGTLDISGISVAGSFVERTDCGATLDAGRHCTITVIFHASKLGNSSGAVTIIDNAAGSPQILTLTGVGTALTVSPTSLNFGFQAEGTTSPPQTVTITNDLKNKAVPVHNIAIHGGNSGAYAETNNCGTSLPAGASCTVSITFTPPNKVTDESTLHIRTGGEENDVTLVGKGR